MHLVYFPKFCITIIFDFSWDDCNTQEKLETMVMQNFRGLTRCIMVYVKMVTTGISNYFLCFKFHSDWGRVIGKIKQNELDCRDTAPFMCQPEAKGSCAAEQGRVNTWDRDELGPVWVRIALNIYISFPAFTWDRPNNELRAVWLCVGRWPDTSYFRTCPRLYSSHVKRKRISDQVHK